MTADLMQNIPDELQLYPQWVRHDAAKRPINPHTGQLADVSDLTTWAKFEDATNSPHGVGIGFVFTNADPFVGIDLDVSEGSQPSEGQQRIYEAFNTYAERSPSGRGLHIIAKGKVKEGGVRNSALGVEVYSSGRFFTFTGNAVRTAPIAECQSLIETLCTQIAPNREAALAEVNDPSPAPQINDETLRERVCESAANRRNYEGQVSDWSNAYFALICAACLFSSDEAQVRRVVMASPLVQDAPHKGRETRAHKADRLWGKEYASAARRGAQERQEQAVGVDHGRQVAQALLNNWQAKNAAVPCQLDWFSAASLSGVAVPVREWLCPGLIPMHDVTTLNGDGGTGKSILAIMLLLSAALGTQWLGQNVRQGRAMLISAEDGVDEIHRRLASMGELSNMSDITVLSLAGKDALLAAQDSRSGGLRCTALLGAIDDRMTAERPTLLVLDTLADFFGGNENDRAQARQFIGMLRGLAIKHQCAVLLLSHPSVAGIQSGVGSSGSTAWNNSVRSRLYLSRIVHEGKEPNPDARVLTTKKSNYGRIGQQIHLHWHDGIFSAIDLPTLETQNVKAESVFLKLLVELKAQGRRVNASAGAQYAPKVFAEHPDNGGITKTAFKTAMQSLFASQGIINVETGPPSRRRSHIEPAGPFQSPSDPQNSAFHSPSNTPADPSSNALPMGVSPTPYNPQGSEGPFEGATAQEKEGTSPC